MILRGIYVYSRKDKESDNGSEKNRAPKGKDAYPCNGDFLMIRRTLHNQPSSQELTQKENIFHTRCKILENTCSLIMYSGLWFNCWNTRFV